jgi:PAS domain S-box-containing protein
MTARLPDDLESRRLAALHELMVLGSEPEPLFDEFAATASRLCETPIALITLIDSEQQWFKANVGVPGFGSTPRDISFCTRTIESDALLEVPDASEDPRFESNPLVRSGPEIRFYAGAPLVLDTGLRVGSICVMDHRPRRLDAAQRAMLASLASMVTRALEMRRDLVQRSLAARTQYEQALARSEAIHRTMVENQTELVSLSNANNELVYVNRAYCIHFRRTAAELIGSDLYVGVNDGDIDDVRRQMNTVFETGKAETRDFRTLDSNGDARWVSWTHGLHIDADGVALLHSVGRDVTERKRLEQALAEQERFMRHVTDNLPLQVAYVGADRRYLFANQPHCRRLGFDLAQIVGRTRSELTAGIDDARIDPPLAAALAGQRQRFTFEVDDHGERKLMETHLIPDVLPDGSVRGVLATAVDVTARIASERSVQELLTIFENTPDFIAQTDAAGLR